MRTIATIWCTRNGWKACVPMYQHVCVSVCWSTIASHNIDLSLNHRDSFQFVSLFIVRQSILSECWSDEFSPVFFVRGKIICVCGHITHTHTYVLLDVYVWVSVWKHIYHDADDSFLHTWRHLNCWFYTIWFGWCRGCCCGDCLLLLFIHSLVSLLSVSCTIHSPFFMNLKVKSNINHFYVDSIKLNNFTNKLSIRPMLCVGVLLLLLHIFSYCSVCFSLYLHFTQLALFLLCLRLMYLWLFVLLLLVVFCFMSAARSLFYL